MEERFLLKEEWEKWKDEWRGRDYPSDDLPFPSPDDPWQWVGINEYPFNTEAICLVYQVYPNASLKEIWQRYNVPLRNDRFLEAAIEDTYDLKHNQGVDTIDKYVVWSKDVMRNPKPLSKEESKEDFRAKLKRYYGIEDIEEYVKIDDAELNPEPKKSFWRQVSSLLPKI